MSSRGVSGSKTNPTVLTVGIRSRRISRRFACIWQLSQGLHHTFENVWRKSPGNLQRPFKSRISSPAKNPLVPQQLQAPPPISRLRHCVQNAVSFEEGNECDVASARTNARGHPVRSDHQGSDEGGQCRSAPAFSNAEGDSANVGRCSCPSSMCLPT
jgi:hypothetical protein